MSGDDSKTPTFGVTDIMQVMDGEKLRALAEKAQKEQERREAAGSDEKPTVKPQGERTLELSRQTLQKDLERLAERKRDQKESEERHRALQEALAAQEVVVTRGKESKDPKASPEAEEVAKALGSISLAKWLAFLKYIVPTMGIILAALMAPVNQYLDSREAAFKTAIMAEIGSTPDGLAEYKQNLDKELDALLVEIKEIESRLGGEIHSSPTAFQNMKKIAEIRERLVAVETRLGIEQQRRRSDE